MRTGTSTPRKRKTSGGSKPPTPKRAKSTKSVRNAAKASTSKQFISDQRDLRVDYVAVKKGTSLKTKREIKFKSKVGKALQSQLPIVTKLYTNVGTSVTNTGTTDQSYVVYHMRPWDGQSATPGAGTLYNEPAQNDLKDISTELTTSMAAGADIFSGNYMVKSSVMEIYVEAIGSMDCVFDIYEIVYQKKKGNPINSLASLTSVLVGSGVLNPQVTNAGGVLHMGIRGVTPFDMGTLIRDAGIKVVKKSTNFVQGGAGGFTYIVKDYRSQKIDQTSLSVDLASKFCIQGFTKSVLIVCKPLVADSSGVAGFRATRDVHYRVQPVVNRYGGLEYSGQN